MHDNLKSLSICAIRGGGLQVADLAVCNAMSPSFFPSYMYI